MLHGRFRRIRRIVVAGLRPNANVLVGVRSIDGYDGGVQITRRWARAQVAHGRPHHRPPAPEQRRCAARSVTASRFGVRYVLIDRRRSGATLAPTWIGPVLRDARFDVFENPAWRVRDRCSPTAIAMSCSTRTVAIDRQHPEHFELDVDAASDGVVSTDQQFDEGWTVTVDGNAADPLAVDDFWLGVAVDAGEHHLVFRYQPAWWRPSLVVALLALGTTVWLLAQRGASRVPAIPSLGHDDRRHRRAPLEAVPHLPRAEPVPQDLPAAARRARWEDFWALRGRLVRGPAEGEAFGIVGHNGSGKSTLLKCLTGILQPDRGRVAMSRLDVGAARARRRLPPRPLRSRERVPERGDPRHAAARSSSGGSTRSSSFAGLERVHRPAGAQLLDRHDRAARVRRSPSTSTPTC